MSSLKKILKNLSYIMLYILSRYTYIKNEFIPQIYVSFFFLRKILKIIWGWSEAKIIKNWSKFTSNVSIIFYHIDLNSYLKETSIIKLFNSGW